MIKVTKINGKEIIMNAELIEFIESTPDTMISMSTGKKLFVKDTPDEIIQKVIEYRGEVFPFKKFKKLNDDEFIEVDSEE